MSYGNRFGDMSPVDMMDEIVELEAKIRRSRDRVSPNDIAKDVMDLVYQVGEREEFHDTVPDEYFWQVTEMVGRVFAIDPYEAVLTIKGERDLLARQRDKMIEMIEAAQYMRKVNLAGQVCIAGMDVDREALLAVYLTDPADDEETAISGR